MKYRMLIMTMLCMWITTSYAETGFDSRYERGYNIFNQATQYQPDNPLNPANAYDPNSSFNPVNRYDPGNPENPVNRYNPNNPFNPVNRYHPDNPLNPANKPALFTRVRDETTEMPCETGARSDEKVGTPSPLFRRNPHELLRRVSYSHIEQLVDLDDDLQRAFYELECMRGNWSVRELKRQIGVLYFERSGLSKDPKKLAALVEASAEAGAPQLNIRDPYVFEFLGLKSKEVMGESDIEDALLDKLQAFLLELGNGFCFEARQKRILIGDTYGFVDLVFYHRILKCHVLIELKLAEFSQEHMGQLNTYVSWFKRNMLTEGDSPPVGLLLCTRKDHALVEYALADIPNRLFVSKYQLELPSRDQIQQFIEARLKEALDG